MNLEKFWPEWTVEEILGQGAYGTVYKIRKGSGGTESFSALKVIHIPVSKSELQNLYEQGMDDGGVRKLLLQDVEALENEIKTMVSLKSAAGIVAIEDYYVEEIKDEIGWVIYIRMELLESLQSYVRRTGQLSRREALDMACDLCDALIACESRHIIHRDIKPANIFRNEFGQFKLGDFGVARQMEGTTSAATRVGTPSFEAPELFMGQGYDHTVDIYGLGMVLYTYLNKGRKPFYPPYPQELTRENMQQAMEKRLSGAEIPAISEVDWELMSILRKACAFRKENRYQTADAMKQALEDYIYYLNHQKSAGPGADTNGTSLPADREGTVANWSGGTASGWRTPADDPEDEPTMLLGKGGQDSQSGENGKTIPGQEPIINRETIPGQEQDPIGATDKNWETVPGQEPLREENEKKTSRKAWVISGLITALVLAGTGGYFYKMFRNEDNGQTLPSKIAAEASGTPTPAPANTESPAPKSTTTPAPKSTPTPAPKSTPTPTPKSTPTPAPKSTPTPTPTNTSAPKSVLTNTSTPVLTSTKAPVPTNTPTPVPTNTPTPVPTNTPTPTNTPVPTNTPTPVPTNTPTPAPTNTPTPVPTNTPTPAPTNTPTPVPTNTPTPVPTNTPTPVPTNTPVPTPTPLMQLEYSQVVNGSALHDIFLDLAESKIDLMQLNPELDHKIKAFARAEEIPSGAEKVLISEIGYLPAYVWFEEETGTLWWYSDAQNLRLNQDCKGMFAFFAGLESVDLSGVQTSDTTDMSEMFYCCESLKNLDLSAFDTSCVTNMRRMFSGCSQLAEVNLKSFDTSNVTDMEAMFYYCEQLKLLDVTGFDTSNVVTMRGMFEGCRSLERLNLSYFDTYSVTDMSGMFRNCTSLEIVDLSGFVMKNVASWDEMFKGCESLKNVLAEDDILGEIAEER